MDPKNIQIPPRDMYTYIFNTIHDIVKWCEILKRLLQNSKKIFGEMFYMYYLHSDVFGMFKYLTILCDVTGRELTCLIMYSVLSIRVSSATIKSRR